MVLDYFARLAARVPVRGGAPGHARPGAGAPRAGRRRRRRSSRGTCRCSPSMLKLAPGARRRLHGGAQAGAGDAARRRTPRRGADGGRVPAGVVNIVPAGREVGEYLVRHPGVDKVSFTGSTAAGRRIAALCGEQLKRVTLELGGKSAAIILDDADLDSTDRRPAAGGDHEQRPGLRRADAHPRARARATARSSRRWPRRSARCRSAIPMDPMTIVRPAGRRAPARARRGLHHASAATRARASPSAAAARRRSTSGWYVEPTLFVDVEQRHAHRARGDLRPGGRR